MSDVIETGAKRRIDSLARPRSQSIGRKRKIDKTRDELELGRFEGKAGETDRARPARERKGRREPARSARGTRRAARSSSRA